MSESRHTGVVRFTHWVTALCFLALLVSGVEILLSHPRFYWGEDGNVLMQPLFTLPLPASRDTVPTGYGFVLPDQNGWSRSLHFQAAWFVVMAGLVYVAHGIATRHFRRKLFTGDVSAGSYNPLQRLTYSVVVFAAFPLAIWTGLAMSPGFVAAAPVTVTALGGQQSARTIHFFVSTFLAGFLFVHIAMVIVSGFRERMRAMIWRSGE